MSDAVGTGRSTTANERHVCVVLHDVATSTRAACQRTLNAIAAVGDVPVTLLAVPRYHGETPTRDFEDWLGQRARAGAELALHGWTHRDDLPTDGMVDTLRRRHYTRSEGEFFALAEADARARIEAGLSWFRGRGWPVHGFVAPAWLLGTGAWRALEGQGFDYTATLRELIHLPGKQRVASQSVVYSTSSAWRRQGSLIWNPVVALMERNNPLLRIELHPRDADFAGIRDSWQAILRHALRSRRPVTVAEFMRLHKVRHAEPAPKSAWPTTTADRN